MGIYASLICIYCDYCDYCYNNYEDDKEDNNKQKEEIEMKELEQNNVDKIIVQDNTLAIKTNIEIVDNYYKNKDDKDKEKDDNFEVINFYNK